MSDPTITFVVLSYNFAPFVRECVDSILNQQGDHPFEVVLVDDASTDGTASILRSFNDPRIHLIQHTQNVGHVATVNEAFSYARGRYIARIDGDDRYRHDYLNSVLPILNGRREVGLVYGDAAVMDERGNITISNSDRIHGGTDHKGNELVALLEENFICSPTVIARREAWESCLPVPHGLAFHDWYFTVLMARRYEFYYCHRVLADYRVHPGNHHTRIVRDKAEEPSIFLMLDTIFDETESSEALERAKRRARRRIYGRHYLLLADKYFGMCMNGDARRCYWAAVRHYPAFFFRLGVQRRLAATIVGRERYERGKAVFKTLRANS